MGGFVTALETLSRICACGEILNSIHSDMLLASKSLFPALILFVIGLCGVFLNRQPAPVDLKILTYNIRLLTDNDKGKTHWTKRRDFLVDTIREDDADIIGFQEAFREQLDFIGKHVAGYSEVGVGREDGESKGEYSAIFFKKHRFDLIDSGTFWLSSKPETPNSTTWGNNVTRICTWARLRTKEGGTRFDVFNTHFDHQSEEARRRGMAQIAARIAKRPEPRGHVIFTGDFNASESSWAFQFITGNSHDLEPLADDASTTASDPVSEKSPIVLRDTFRAAHPDSPIVGTFHGFRGTSRGGKIDHIFVESKGNRILSADVWKIHRDGQYPSDHFPVRAMVRFW